MKIEVWTSDQNQEEIHHFVEDERNTYLFGFNQKLLGENYYWIVYQIVQEALEKAQAKKL